MNRCLSCNRYSRSPSCQFCGATTEALPPIKDTTGLARSAAVVGIAASAVLAATMGACSSSQPAYGISIPEDASSEDGSTSPDGETVQPAYGAPAIDASPDVPNAVDAAYGGPPLDASGG